MKRISLYLIYFISFIYLEFLLKILLGYNHIFMFSNLHMIIFLSAAAFLFCIISKLFSEKVNKRIFFILEFIICVWFAAQFVVTDVFGFYIDYDLMTGAGTQVTEGVFFLETLKQIAERLWGIILLFIPFILPFFFKKKINFKKSKISKIVFLLIIVILNIGIYRVSLLLGKNKTYSSYELVYKVKDTALNMEKLGVIDATYLDVKRLLFGFEEDINIVIPVDDPIDEPEDPTYKLNNLDIDFTQMLSESKNASEKQMTEFFMSEAGTYQNEYTGFFENKNLIMFMAESFNELAVSEELTPTLYKLIHNGFEFTHFYSPTIYSTIGGEMQELTGLYPSAYGTFKQGTTKYTMGLGKVFADKGYSTYAYHNHTYTFQGRNKYLQALGFTNFKGCGNGLQSVVNCKAWPESDIELINGTFDEYINSEKPFMVWYSTVSGHGSWSWNTNPISKKYKSEVTALNLNIPADIQAYMASQIELDRALETLITKLEEAGKIDDTVIVLTGDHYPYMLTESGRDEEIRYFTKTLGKDLNVEINHSNLIIWNNAMDKVTIDKVGSQIDIIPTVYNLFAIPYDSRLIIGKDILATNEGLAMFANRSWVTDRGTYYTATGKFVPVDGYTFDVDISEELENEVAVKGEDKRFEIEQKLIKKAQEEAQNEYVKVMNNLVKNRINMSGSLVKSDYYTRAWKYMNSFTDEKPL